MQRYSLFSLALAVCIISGCDLFGGADDPLLTSTPPWRTEALNPNPVTGAQTVAVIMARSSNMEAFQNGPEAYDSLLFGPESSVNSYISELSGGLASITGDVFGPYDLPDAISCDGSRDDINAALRAAMVEAADGDVNFTQYGRVMFIHPELTEFNCLYTDRYATAPVPFATDDGAASAALMHMKDNESLSADGIQTRQRFVDRFSRGILGTFGLGTAGGYLCVDGIITQPNNCQFESSIFPMSMFGVGAFVGTNPNVIQREWLGWVPESEIMTATESASYVLKSEDGSGSGAIALRIPLNTSLSIDTSSPTGTVEVNELYVEYRSFSPTLSGVLIYTWVERDRRTVNFGVAERELVVIGFDAHPDHKPTDGFQEWFDDFSNSPFVEGDTFEVDGIRVEVESLDGSGTAHVRVSR